MKIISYGVRPIEEYFFHDLNISSYELTLIPELLTDENVEFCKGADVLLLRGNCQADRKNLTKIKEYGVQYILTRTTGYDHIDLEAVKDLDFKLCARVPSYSPNAISELAVSLALGLRRKSFAILAKTSVKNYIAYDDYFAKEIRLSTVGIIGVGRIGMCSIKAFQGLGAKTLGYDPFPSEEAKNLVELVSLDTLLTKSDIVVLHCPYFKDVNSFLVNKEFIAKMKDKSILINTARGELVDLSAVLEGIESGKLAGVGLDVLERERDCFFKDHVGQKLLDPIVEKLVSYYPKVIVTPHLGSFTDEALTNMIKISYSNLEQFLQTGFCDNNLQL